MLVVCVSTFAAEPLVDCGAVTAVDTGSLGGCVTVDTNCPLIGCVETFEV